MRDDPEHVRVMYVRAQPGKPDGAWTLMEKPLWQLDVDEHASLELFRASGEREKPELLVIEARQVLHVRFP